MSLRLCAAGLCATVIAAAWSAAPAEAAQKARAVSQPREQVAATRPRARITVQRRSFLDAGTVVNPGERKFTDYAFPPGYSPTSVIDNHAGMHRGPLPGPFDLPSRQNPYPW
jgi:hypothetical protein